MPEIPPDQSLIEYPSAFPIKVMGVQTEGFEDAMVAVAQAPGQLAAAPAGVLGPQVEDARGHLGRDLLGAGERPA